jgi:sec-independent protein translocase protein TatA
MELAYHCQHHDEEPHFMFRQIGTGEIVLIVAVLVLFFGSRKLPDLARSIGKSARELRKGLSGDDDDEDDPDEDQDKLDAAD